MIENLVGRGGLTMAEPVMLGLAEKSKRKVWAHQLVHDIAIKVAEKNGNFSEEIGRHPDIKAHLSSTEIQTLLDPTQYIGTAVEQVDNVVRDASKRRRKLTRDFARTIGYY